MSSIIDTVSPNTTLQGPTVPKVGPVTLPVPVMGLIPVKPAVVPMTEQRDFLDPAITRHHIFENVLVAARALQPIANVRHRLELSDVDYTDNKDYSLKAQKAAIMRGETLNRRLRGTWKLFDVGTNELVDQKTVTLANVPYMTNRGTFVLGGSEYSLSNQMRLRPGIFTRIKENGEIESHVNIMPGKGLSHRYFLDPATGIFKINIGQSKVPIMPVLRALGATDPELRAAWGDELFAINSQKDDPVVLNKIFTRLARRSTATTHEEKRKAIADEFLKMELDPEVTRRTLGKDYKHLTKEAVLATTGKLLRLSRGEEEPDDRDHLAFQTFMGPEDLIAERIGKDKTAIRQLLWKAFIRGNLGHVQPGTFTKQINHAIMGSGLGQALEESNASDILDQLGRVSKLGEGGVPSIDSVPDESRSVQPSHFGFIDPIRSPESFKVGIDSRLTYKVRKGKDGQLYTPVRDVKSGEMTWKTPSDLADSVLAFPNELNKDKPIIAAMVKGRTSFVPRELADYIMPEMENAFSPLANMIPGKSGVKGQRVAMGARFLTQALPVRDAESPFVQSALPDDASKSFEELYGKHMGAVRADKPGKVVKIDPDSITIKHDDGEVKEYDTYDSFPFNRKTYIHNTPVIQTGARVEANQLLAKSNYTDNDGATALGKNVRVAYIPFRGLNYEDAYVVSEGFAKKMTSEHMYQNVHEYLPSAKHGKKTFISTFANKYDKAILDKMDEDGVIKVGEEIHYGDPIVFSIQEKEPSFSQIHRGRGLSYSDKTMTWDHHAPGVITDVAKTSKGIAVAIKAFAETQVGDKISGRYGDKGVISAIIKDDEMPHDEEGRPYEVLANPLGIISRCYDDKTEFLTERGWAKGADVKADDKFAAYDPDTGDVNFEKQTASFHTAHYQGDMYYYEASHVDFAVTPNHTMLARCDFPGAEWQVTTVDRIAFHRWWVPSVDNLVATEAKSDLVSPQIESQLLEENGWRKEQYVGIVYCPSVKSGFVVTRRNGKPLIAGNSNPMQMVEAALGKIAEKTGKRYKFPDFKDIDDITQYAIDELQKHGIKDQETIIDPTTGRKIPNVFTGNRFIMKLHHTAECFDADTEVLTASGWKVWPDVKEDDKLATVENDKLVFEKPLELVRQHFNGELYCFSNKHLDYAVTGNHRFYVAGPITNWAFEFRTAADMHQQLCYVCQLDKNMDWVPSPLTDGRFSLMPYNGVVYCANMRTGFLYVRRNRKHMLSGNSKGQGRGIGSYTSEQVPSKGGEEGSKRISLIDSNALLSHGATEILRDASAVRGQRNDQYWQMFMSGFRPPEPNVPFVYRKFITSLQAAGINPVRKGGQVHVMALTDKDVDKLAGDRYLRNAETVEWKEGLKPIGGGLFDDALTGGHGGESKWAAIKLTEPMPNPVFEEPIRRLLGLTQKQYEEVLSGKSAVAKGGKLYQPSSGPDLFGYGVGPDGIYKALKSINIDREIEEARTQINSGRKTARDVAVRKLGYLKALKRLDQKPSDWMLHKVPVIPPAFRPVSVLSTTKAQMVADSNYLYKELFDANSNLQQMKDVVDDVSEERLNVYNAFKAVTGLGDPISPKNQERKVTGILRSVFGASPKLGTVQFKLLGSAVDLVGRAVITPNPDLDMDHVGLPENRAWTVYMPFIIRRMVRNGVPRLQAAKAVKERNNMAREAMLDEMRDRPIIINRAPVLHRYGFMAAWPILTKDDVLQLSPIVTKGFGADFDGDAMQYHVHATDEAKEEAIAKMLPSRNLLSVAGFKAHYMPSQEYLGGLYAASTKLDKDKRPRIFDSAKSVISAIERGEIGVEQPVEILRH